jgi:two-component system sensor histidine kinase UhpB
MRLPGRFRSYRWFIIARIVLPLALVIFALVFVGGVLYQQVITTLVIERHQQLASLMAVSVSQVLDSYTDALQVLGSRIALDNSQGESLGNLLEQTVESLEFFNGGVVVVDSAGSVVAESANTVIRLGPSVADLEVYRQAQANLAPTFGYFQAMENSGREYFIVAVPLGAGRAGFSGALLGILDLRTADFGEPLRQLTADEERRAYLVDDDGTIIFHSEEEEIGSDMGDRPFVDEMSAGRSGGLVTRGPDGERLVEGFAPIPGTDWGLILQESWALVAGSLQFFDAIIIFVGVIITIAIALLAWRSVDQVITPIQLLAEQSARLAEEEQIEAPRTLRQGSGIQEIDDLERAFSRMAKKVNDYRAGMHRYVGEITQSQEDERRRIARDLHDETVQSLLAIARHLELYQSQTSNPEHLDRLNQLKDMVDETITGVRHINRGLRPLMLEDLGLEPALQTLVREAGQDVGAVDEASFETLGDDIDLNAEQELAIYRITQEALTNVRKHARASRVEVQLIYEESMVRLEISDDGIGFEVPQAMTDFARQRNFGLLGIKERVIPLGGTAAIRSNPGEGTRLSVTLPVQREG